MGVKNFVKRAGERAGNKVAKYAALSPDQVAEIQLKRENYLLEMPNSSDAVARELTERMMAASSIEIFNAFLSQIKELYLPVSREAEYGECFNTDYNIRYFNITKWVTDKKENSLEKLVNVYAVLSNEDCNIALVFNRTQSKTNVYLAVVNTQNADNKVDVDIYKNRLLDAIRGNFPGAEWQNEGMGIMPCLKNEKAYSVATASNIPTEKSEKFISQTIEKLLDGIIPDSNKKEYTIVLLATPIKDVEERKLKLGEFYSGMAPYATWQTSYQIQENHSTGSSATVGVNVGASAGIQNGQNYSTTQSDSETDSRSKTDTENQSNTLSEGKTVTQSTNESHSDGTSHTKTTTDGSSYTDSSSTAHSDGKNSSVTNTKGSSDTVGGGVTITAGVSESVSASAGGGIVPASASVGVQASQSVAANINYNHGWNRSVAEATGTSMSDTITYGLSETQSKSLSQALGKTATDTITNGISNTISNTVAKTTGTAVANTLGKAVTTAMAKTAGTVKSASLGANFGANFARSSTITAIIGKNEGINQTFMNYNIKHALELLENQMKRLEQSTALGMWDFAAYVLSEDSNTANNVAHSYLALTLGEESYMSKSAINLWRGNIEAEKTSASEISAYIKELRHPIFALNPEIVNMDESYSEYPSVVTATTSLSGKELAYSLNFPQKSIAGLPILECAEFGRNVVTYDSIKDEQGKIHLGNVFHMNHMENTKIDLNIKSLASHTFITGSTGSGKSNTIYQVVAKARKKGIKFLIIEPAKGEYKNVFGGMKDVSVFSTNPIITPLLRINPFSFPEKIHVLEHLDRLIEIFNACWPMYAAMPAVLKSAVEKSYVDCGWDLVQSVNKYGEELYPTFVDVASNIKEIIDTSEYDSDNKGAYKGSLLTRLQSLSTGINGMIFGPDEISSVELFDENVIVDLSRVGSTETKALIMGMLVLKLQEYRMCNNSSINAELQHLTVLEEAHNILRRTSIEQSAETSNLLGKSVEMISNAIAEMRTYGEGFIIADQAPGLLDMSVIRNTNTKIILRLPDQGDRELVGRAANLNEDQIQELAKLPCGVAALYQNEWIQPVLCKVERFDKPEKPFEYEPCEELLNKSTEITTESLLECIMNKEIFKCGDRADIQKLKALVIKSRLDSAIKVDFMEYIAAEKDKAIESLRTLVYDFFSAEDAIRNSKQCENINEWVHAVVDGLTPSIKDYSKKQINLVLALMLYEQTLRDASYGTVFCKFTEVYKSEGGVF